MCCSSLSSQQREKSCRIERLAHTLILQSVGKFGYRRYSICLDVSEQRILQVAVLRQYKGLGGSASIHKSSDDRETNGLTVASLMCAIRSARGGEATYTINPFRFGASLAHGLVCSVRNRCFSACQNCITQWKTSYWSPDRPSPRTGEIQTCGTWRRLGTPEVRSQVKYALLAGLCSCTRPVFFIFGSTNVTAQRQTLCLLLKRTSSRSVSSTPTHKREPKMLAMSCSSTTRERSAGFPFLQKTLTTL